MGKNFGVTKDGYLYTSGGGRIASWTISKNSLNYIKSNGDLGMFLSGSGV